MAYIVDEQGNSKPVSATNNKNIKENFTHRKKKSACNYMYIIFLLFIIALCIYGICKISCSKDKEDQDEQKSE